MKPADRVLQRLLEAAARAPEEAPGALPFGVETGVLARWRSGALAGDEFVWPRRLFRHAMVCAGLIMALCIAWSARENTSAAASAVALANYEINTHLPP